MLDVFPDSPESVLANLFVLETVIHAFAIGARRLHDTGKSGWWWLIVFIPFLGAIILLLFFVRDSEPATNDYGPSPKPPTRMY